MDVPFIAIQLARLRQQELIAAARQARRAAHARATQSPGTRSRRRLLPRRSWAAGPARLWARLRRPRPVAQPCVDPGLRLIADEPDSEDGWALELPERDDAA